jgi:rubrerythrin
MSETEIDILSIDTKIRQKFENEQKSLPEYEQRLLELEVTSKSDKLSYRTRSELDKNIRELKQKINKINKNGDINFYTAESAELLQQYNRILKTPLKISFIGKPTHDIKEKKKIISQYLKIAQKYYDIPLETSMKKQKLVCNNCPNKNNFIFDENICICPECGAQQEILQHNSSYKDVDRVNISTKYTYDRKVHFRDCINQYQGKQNCTIEQKVYDDLEDSFERHHLLLGKKDDKKEIRFANITKEHILMFLRELGYSKHYENVTLIHYNITTKKPDDISYLENKLLDDFDTLIETYDKHFKNKVDRVNFISTQYVLFQLLQRHHHPCRKEDFVILKTVDRKSFHDTVFKEISSLLNWNMVPLY